ncbi:MAG: hypothetical protein HC904_02315 [Blastochloris sp.]|nr:hypothetical protein [Blastochloris sp.]
MKSAPEVPWDKEEDWAFVTDYPPKDWAGSGQGKQDQVVDWTESVQQAIDAGKSTVAFPPGPKYMIRGTVHIRGKVRRFLGLESEWANVINQQQRGQILVEDGDSPVVVWEQFKASYAGLLFTHIGKRTWVNRNNSYNQYTSITKMPGSGDLFLDDMCWGHLNIQGGNVWARQQNNEGTKVFTTKVLNDGGNLWILGFKTEDDAVLIHTRNGGRTEVLGGFIYANKANDPNKIMFLCEDSFMSFSVAEAVIRKQPFAPIRVRRGGEEKTLTHGNAYPRAGGSLVPLFVENPEN